VHTTTRTPGLRVVIDARLVSGEAGGVEGVVIGLAYGLSRLDGPEAYDLVAWEGQTDWLEPHIGGASRVVTTARPAARAPRSARAPAPGRGRLLAPLRAARRLLRSAVGSSPAQPAAPARPPRAFSLPQPDRFVVSLAPDVVHMPIQRGFVTNAPSIYHPHDLQHVHLPQFLNEGQRAWRERWYGDLCRRAAMVAVSSEWTRRDVSDHFDLPDGRVRVVPLAPPLATTREPTAQEGADVRARLNLPDRYVLYRAQTWPHKNHIRLVEALARLRARDGLTVPLVATGRRTEHWAEIDSLARSLGLADQLIWTDFVPALDLQALFREARAVVIPTLFEAASAPLWEAFAAGVPAACSNVTSLPEQAGDAAVVFDPLDLDAISDAVGAVWTDEALRETLIRNGRARVRELSWDRTARIFRAHYRRLAGRELTEEDRALVG